MTTAHLVNHTHWDREWYFTTMDAQVLSEPLFTEVLDELEKNEKANFCLDGQVSVVNEYVEIHPEAKARIQKLVDAGRLFIGPWYTQTDALLPDAESIIRNLVIGINDTKENYGQAMEIGYLPDTFGFNAQMPTLFRQVNIDNMLFWRGINFDKQVNSVYFRWHGLGNQEILAVNFPFGYFTGQITSESKQRIGEYVRDRYDPAVNFAAEHGDHEDILIPSGIDQMNIVKNIKKTVEELNKHSQYRTVIDTYPDFVESMRKKKKSLPEYKGELRFPTYARVHRSIGSVRHGIKMQNFLLEQKILKRVEPLCVIGAHVGIQVGNGLLIKLWKKLLECQAHDTLGGSVSDNVAIDIQHRFKETHELADGIENMIKKKIAEYLHLQSNQVIVFNTEPHTFIGNKTVQVVSNSKNIRIEGMENQEITSIKHYPARENILTMTPKGQEFIDEPEYFVLEITGEIELPGLGYKVFELRDTTQELPKVKMGSYSSFASISFNEKELQFTENRIDLINNGRRIKNILSIVDSANDGDTYDYSPLKGDGEIDLPLHSASIKTSLSGDYLCVRGAAYLPKDLENRESNEPQYASLSYLLELSFNENGQLCTHLSLDNQVKSHRVRLKFSPKINTEKVKAQIQAGYLETENMLIDENWREKFVEKPVNIYNFDKTLTLEENQRHFTFWCAGQKEYEYKNRQLYVTLLSTTGELGKPDIAWRPGRASGDTTSQGHIMMSTPIAQELGENEFDFAFSLSDISFDESENNRLTRQWLAPNISYQNQNLNVFVNRLDNKIWNTEGNPEIPTTLSLLEFSKDIDVAAVYPAYSDGKYYIVRLQNLTDKTQTIPDKLLDNGIVVNALEEKQEQVEVGPYDLASVKIQLKNNFSNSL